MIYLILVINQDGIALLRILSRHLLSKHILVFNLRNMQYTPLPIHEQQKQNRPEMVLTEHSFDMDHMIASKLEQGSLQWVLNTVKLFY